MGKNLFLLCLLLLAGISVSVYLELGYDNAPVNPMPLRPETEELLDSSEFSDSIYVHHFFHVTYMSGN